MNEAIRRQLQADFVKIWDAYFADDAFADYTSCEEAYILGQTLMRPPSPFSERQEV